MLKITRRQKPLYVGDDGVLQTLLEMERLVLRDANDPQIKAKVRELKGKSDRETVTNIYNFVWKNWSYKSDPAKEEHITAPVHLLNNCGRLFGCKHVDCDDYSMLLSCLLVAAGYDTAFRVLSWRAKHFTHVYVMVSLPGEEGMLPLDAVMKDKGLFQEKTRKAHIRTLTFPVGEALRNILSEQRQSSTMADLLNSFSMSDRAAFSNAIIPSTHFSNSLMDTTLASNDTKAKNDPYLKTDFLAMGGRIVGAMGFPPNMDNVAKQLKTEVVQMCQVETDNFITKRIVQIGLGGLGVAAVAGTIGYFVGKRKKS